MAVVCVRLVTMTTARVPDSIVHMAGCLVCVCMWVVMLVCTCVVVYVHVRSYVCTCVVTYAHA